jgi:acid stress chaperone HdeB
VLTAVKEWPPPRRPAALLRAGPAYCRRQLLAKAAIAASRVQKKESRAYVDQRSGGCTATSPLRCFGRIATVRNPVVNQSVEWIMHPKCVVSGLILALFAALPARAQVTVDVTKINCDQFVHHKISEPRLIAAWLSGYYNAKRNNRVIDLQMLDENMSKVKNYCSDEKNFKVPVMKAVEQVLGKSK